MEKLKIDNRMNLLGLDNSELAVLVKKRGHKPFRATQVQRWIYKYGVSTFDKMTDLSNDLREFLRQTAFVDGLIVNNQQHSLDGTIKWLFQIDETNLIETVFIPERNRGTLCISSQSGCAVNCRFCSTGRQGFNRNLTTREIISQVWQVNGFLNEFSDSHKSKKIESNKIDTDLTYKISNIVMMGMGEPLLNYKELISAIKILVNDNYYGLSKRKITISTSGIVPMIDRLSKDCPVSLAVSLHASNNTLRNDLVPINKKYPLESLLDACKRYLVYAPRKFITFEYCMLDSINDSDKDIKELIILLSNINCKVNLIPFNPFPNSGLRCSSIARIKNVCQQINNSGIFATIRKTRGDDINAACGQLVGQVSNKIKISKHLFDIAS